MILLIVIMIISTVIIVIVIIVIVIIDIVILVIVLLVMLVIVLKIMLYVDSSVCKKKCLISFLEAEVLITIQGSGRIYLSADEIRYLF